MIILMGCAKPLWVVLVELAILVIALLVLWRLR